MYRAIGGVFGAGERGSGMGGQRRRRGCLSHGDCTDGVYACEVRNIFLSSPAVNKCPGQGVIMGSAHGVRTQTSHARAS